MVLFGFSSAGLPAGFNVSPAGFLADNAKTLGMPSVIPSLQPRSDITKNFASPFKKPSSSSLPLCSLFPSVPSSSSEPSVPLTLIDGARCKRIYDDNALNAHAVCLEVCSALRLQAHGIKPKATEGIMGTEFLKALEVEVRYELKPKIVWVNWSPPIPGYLKLNVDGASKGNPGRAGGGAVGQIPPKPPDVSLISITTPKISLNPLTQSTSAHFTDIVQNGAKASTTLQDVTKNSCMPPTNPNLQSTTDIAKILPQSVQLSELGRWCKCFRIATEGHGMLECRKGKREEENKVDKQAYNPKEERKQKAGISKKDEDLKGKDKAWQKVTKKANSKVTVKEGHQAPQFSNPINLDVGGEEDANKFNVLRGEHSGKDVAEEGKDETQNHNGDSIT
ncbi:unnamed protein product [Ilex paraguariensis]|uniref:Uncharacterized protein n=1 Tax=Ilex paraguariensis TaxID=185542 RepID=A0ABC8TCR4_9AQUA